MKTLDMLRRYQQMTEEPEKMTDWQAVLWHASGLVKVAKRLRGTDRRSHNATMVSPFIQEELFK